MSALALSQAYVSENRVDYIFIYQFFLTQW